MLLLQAFCLLSANALPSASADRRASDLDLPKLPFDTGIPDALRLNELYGAPANDFACKSKRNPVVLLHGLSANREVDLNMLQWELNRRGYCAFSQTYGAHGAVSWIGGLRSMADSAKDIAAFIREVKDKTGARKVDLVGHSEGGVQALYVPMAQAGISGIVEHVVALGPAVHGARYFGFTDLWYIGGEATRKIAKLVVDTLGCPACEDMATDGAIYKAFKSAKKIVQDGNKATVIMSRSDTLVAPDVSKIEEKGVNNVYVQDICPDDKVGHAGLMWDKSVWRLIFNALEENKDEVFKCEKGLEV
ncbi:alpha/beta-hydrolase [Whalleya microplaca]|nr:alpha/beta-hydrolase [Whalleya microplaca]